MDTLFDSTGKPLHSSGKGLVVNALGSGVGGGNISVKVFVGPTLWGEVSLPRTWDPVVFFHGVLDGIECKYANNIFTGAPYNYQYIHFQNRNVPFVYLLCGATKHDLGALHCIHSVDGIEMHFQPREFHSYFIKKTNKW